MHVTIPLSDYKRLLESAELDDMIVWCETCGAWIDRNDDAFATAEDFTGCWKAATCDSKYDHLCRSYRATVADETVTAPTEQPALGQREPDLSSA